MQRTCKVVVPSYGRPDRVGSLTLRVLPFAALVVPERQVDQYREHNPDTEVIGHPDHVRGITPARQWIYEKFGDVFMVDDDVTAMRRNHIRLGEKSEIAPSTAYDIIQMTFWNAIQAGCYLFGFGSLTEPGQYSSNKPVSLNGYVNGTCTGLVAGSKLRYDLEYVGGEDHYISLMSAYIYRKTWIDKRFSFSQKDTMSSTGGMAQVRTIETEKIDTLRLIKHFGKCVRVKRQTPGRKILNPYARVINIPI